jgi:hypothetical protein
VYGETMPGLNKTIQSPKSARFGTDAWEQIQQRPELCPEIVSLPVIG